MSAYTNAREEMNQILNQEEYQVYYEDNRSLLEIIWSNIKEWFTDLLSKLNIPVSSDSAIGNTIIITVMAILAIAIILLFLLVIMNIVRRRKLRSSQPLQSNRELEWSYEKHLREAEKQANEGQFRIATRHHFLALLLILRERNLLEVKRWKTNWEYYDELRKKDKDLANNFYQAALFFEQATYGERKVEENDYQTYYTTINELISAIIEGFPNEGTGDSS
ncbi:MULTISPECIES: DUF4129 domain-containing protein [Gracilibacillus]|uniref:DUF4129 domain-containing protein n=1 Tax=Gracilibacillus dipsosauri TaxID=178340 RepID=A0A317L2H1_9BACI|nr:DUF4129 domain-containing protein [Gracilibacillus dipsosauri]PWU67989.1 DUF4129 domain-containing protein [Gracilibacillus dipsosauri]